MMMSPLLVVGIAIFAPSIISASPEPEADLKTKCQNDPSCYWWMGQESPFKRASSKDSHFKNSFENRDLNANNPFFNGQFEQLPANSNFNAQNQGSVDLNKNPFFNNEKPVFPTAHPIGVENGGAAGGDYSQNPFLQNMFTANGSRVSNEGFIGVQPRPFSSNNDNTKFDDNDFVLVRNNCQGDGFLCVPKEQCQNGVLVEYVANGLRSVKKTDESCDLNTNACCKIPTARDGAIDRSRDIKILLPDNESSSFVTAGKSSIPESLLRFGGLPGFSPGTIQILPVEINNAGEFGSSHLGESTQKPTRDITSSSRNFNNVFGATPDYSNVNFEDVRFDSSIQGPAYLPPRINPIVPAPSSDVPNLEVPTYKPSVNNQYITPKPKPKPFVPEYLPPSTQRPQITFQTQRPTTYYQTQRPFSTTQRPTTIYRPQPSPSQPFPSYSSPKPTSNRDYLPPAIPTSSSNVNNQFRPYPTTTPKPRPQPTSYLPPRPTSPPFTSSYRPKPTVIYQPSPSYQNTRVTPGYTYQQPSTTQRPTPGYTYQKPSPTPGYTYQKPSPTPGYTYPKPTPSFEYPKPTAKPVVPSSSFNVPITSSTPGYTYQRPSPTIPGYTYQRPSPTTPRPTYTYPTTQRVTYTYPTTQRPTYTYPSTAKVTPGYTYQRPTTPGYSYPKPTPEFKLPEPQPSNVVPSVTPTYLPPTKVTPGYNYPKPTPTFGYPDRDGASGNQNNQYIPPPKKPQPEQDGSDTSDTSVKVRPSRPPTTPDYQPDQSGTNENVLPPASCAAALKCVQEIYCTAEGVVSPVPVVLTKEQAQNRVPTTVCRDIGSGTTGVCCRDPNYKDPWPSANLVNGFDDGQYKEDDSIGQYKQSLNDIAQYRPEFARPQRSNQRRNNVKNYGTNENLRIVDDASASCGVRHTNTSPKGPGPLNTNFAEIPWQAMILRDSNRSLLCGGAIIKRNAVLTTANCIEGIQTSDILVKGGEWKLGIDEEPLPFQIVKVSVIVRHPNYRAGSLVNDLAVLILEEKLRPAKNIGTICLPEPNKIPTRNCIATGWGKRILQLHAKGAVMRAVDISIMDNEQCRETLQNTYQSMMPNYSPNTLCGFSGKDQCKVDYGSALACANDNNQYVLSGVFSWDTGCKDQNQIGGYVAPDVEWINDTLGKPVKVLKKLPNAHF